MIINIHASDGDVRIMYNLEAIIFNHDFAKALWGNPSHNPKGKPGKQITNYGWQYHLQQMVIAENPLDYLKENM